MRIGESLQLRATRPGAAVHSSPCLTRLSSSLPTSMASCSLATTGRLPWSRMLSSSSATAPLNIPSVTTGLRGSSTRPNTRSGRWTTAGMALRRGRTDLAISAKAAGTPWWLTSLNLSTWRRKRIRRNPSPCSATAWVLLLPSNSRPTTPLRSMPSSFPAPPSANHRRRGRLHRPSLRTKRSSQPGRTTTG